MFLRTCAITISSALIIASFSLPATATVLPTAEVPDSITVEGTVLNLPTEIAPIEIESGQATKQPEITSEGGTFIVSDDVGVSVQIDDRSAQGLESGQTASATLEVPEAVKEDVSQQAPNLDDEELQKLIVDTSELKSVEMPVAEINGVPLGAASSKGSKKHYVDVVVATYNDSLPSEQDVKNAISYASDYWQDQTDGKISSISVSGSISFKKINRGNAWDICANDVYGMWNNAATIKNRSSMESYLSSSNRHLLMLVDADSCFQGEGVGLGSIGSKLQSGGVLWATVNFDKMNQARQVLVHEFGHNFSLDHSNQRYCSAKKSDARDAELLTDMHLFWGKTPKTGCTDFEYSDYYDPMSASLDVDGVNSYDNLAALNITSKKKLGVLTNKQIKKVRASGGSAQTFKINEINSSGLIGLEIIDPNNTKDSLFVEYRSGQGRDQESFYMNLPKKTKFKNTGAGVRVLKQNVNPRFVEPVTYSTALQTWLTKNVNLFDGRGKVVPYLSKGQKVKSGTNQVTVSVVSSNTKSATVRVNFRPMKATKVTVSGTKRVGKKLKASTKGWGPKGVKYSYQWHVNGKKIKGATKKTLTLKKSHHRKRITVTITGKKSGYKTVSKKSKSVKIGYGVLKSKKPTISGSKKVGKKLTAKVGKWTKGTKFTYQWRVNGKKIKGATKKTFYVSKKYVNKRISVTVKGKQNAYKNKSRTSTKYKIKR